MPKFVVLLRGVNVGKANRVAMSEFKQMLEQLGYAEVRTLLNSGNAVFGSSGRSSRKHAEAIAASIEQTFGITTPVIVKSATELAAIIDGNPMAPRESDHSQFLVAFAQNESALRAFEPLLTLATEEDRFEITEHAAYLHCSSGLLESKVGAAMLGKKTMGVTTRNWATVLKLDLAARISAKIP